MKDPKKVLLVEDDPLISNIYLTSLKRAGYEVDTLFSGAEVMEQVKKNRYDLLLLDIVLPEENGFNVLKDIIRNNLKGNMIIFVLSNLGQQEKIDKAKQMGADYYLIKADFTPREVINKIREAMEKA